MPLTPLHLVEIYRASVEQSRRLKGYVQQASNSTLVSFKLCLMGATLRRTASKLGLISLLIAIEWLCYGGLFLGRAGYTLGFAAHFHFFLQQSPHLQTTAYYYFLLTVLYNCMYVTKITAVSLNSICIITL